MAQILSQTLDRFGPARSPPGRIFEETITLGEKRFEVWGFADFSSYTLQARPYAGIPPTLTEVRELIGAAIKLHPSVEVRFVGE